MSKKVKKKKLQEKNASRRVGYETMHICMAKKKLENEAAAHSSTHSRMQLNDCMQIGLK